MPSLPMASTPCGSWESGSGALSGLKSPCETRGCLKISREPSPIFRLRTMSARPIVCAATSSTNISVGRRGSQRPVKLLQSATSVSSSILFRTMSLRTTLGSSSTLNISSGEIRKTLREIPASFFETGADVFACGRDPYFPAWPDVLQLNAFQPGLREAVIETVSKIAEQCDGIRCDMAMLLLNNIFERTWGDRAGEKPVKDYWRTMIPAIKEKHERVQVHRRSLLGLGVGTATTGF